jgi:hypothetical protein
VVDHVNDEPHEAIDEVLPSTRLASQTAIQQTAINFGQRHRHHLLATTHSAQFTLLAARSFAGSDSAEKTWFDRARTSGPLICGQSPLTTQF